ncbi:MAG TPA: Uma2 family endonuclease [Candidatus Limnocylindrales bacterium]|nr:Uma2 family endonuclease [Candidatus Limnocylindrales bacterium]
MSVPYQETLSGTPLLRKPPGERHELICSRLHRTVQASVSALTSTRLLAPRDEVRLSPTTLVRPDLALVTAATGKLWLAAEIVSSDDHATDTVVKKQLYEELKLPRLWMVDPRYDNVELYSAGPYGMVLQGILGGNEVLTEKLLPDFQISITELFKPASL